MAAPQPTVESVFEALHDVIDPELGYNIVDLGLVYGAEIDDETLRVTMTMTTPGCPAQDYIVMGVRERAMMIPGIGDVDVSVVWEPRWSPQAMSPAAKAHFHVAGSTTDDGQSSGTVVMELNRLFVRALLLAGGADAGGASAASDQERCGCGSCFAQC